MSAKRWRCFHCDEVFTSRRAAWLHFGEENCTSDVPACVDPLRADEAARLNEVRELREALAKTAGERDDAQDAASLLEQYRDELGQLFGTCGGVQTSTPQEAWLKLEAVRSLAAAWQSKYETLKACCEAIGFRPQEEPAIPLQPMRPTDDAVRDSTVPEAPADPLK